MGDYNGNFQITPRYKSFTAVETYSAGASLAQQRIAGSMSEDSGSAMFLDSFEDLGQQGRKLELAGYRWILTVCCIKNNFLLNFRTM
jgi:hypothetical protein